MKPDADGWYQHDGVRRPKTGERKLYVRIRCADRMQVETRQEPQTARWWKRWKHNGDAGDIMEWKFA